MTVKRVYYKIQCFYCYFITFSYERIEIKIFIYQGISYLYFNEIVFEGFSNKITHTYFQPYIYINSKSKCYIILLNVNISHVKYC